MASTLPVLGDIQIKDMGMQYAVTGTYRVGPEDPHKFVLTLETSDQFPYTKGRTTLYFVGDVYKRPIEPKVSKELMQAVVDQRMDAFEKVLDSYVSFVLHASFNRETRK